MNKPTINRREALMTSITAVAALMAGSCAPKPEKTSSILLPDTPWPGYSEDTRTIGKSEMVRAPIERKDPPIRKVEKKEIKPIPKDDPILGEVLPRSKWTRARVNRGDANPMGKISRITIHHEGSIPVLFNDFKTSATRLEQIRRFHTTQRGWADIGYHYIIDRGGRVWEGRPIAFQGAHVRNHNVNNLGIMILGNFNNQNPSNAQLKTLPTLVKALRKKYKVSLKRVKTHQEYNPTSCPGKSLQANINKMRLNRQFG